MQHPATSRRPLRALLALAVMLTAMPLAASALAAPPSAEITEPTWINGRVERFWATFSGAAASADRETMFVVGAQDEANPQERVEGFDHDHVMNNIPYGRRATCHAWAVVVNDGPFTDRVHARGNGLVYEVDLGQGFVAVVSTVVVNQALAQGLVTLSDVGFPDFTCWTTRQG